MGSIIEKNQRSTISCYCTFKGGNKLLVCLVGHVLAPPGAEEWTPGRPLVLMTSSLARISLVMTFGGMMVKEGQKFGR
jgi:hypothetical protein